MQRFKGGDEDATGVDELRHLNAPSKTAGSPSFDGKRRKCIILVWVTRDIQEFFKLNKKQSLRHSSLMHFIQRERRLTTKEATQESETKFLLLLIAYCWKTRCFMYLCFELASNLRP